MYDARGWKYALMPYANSEAQDKRAHPRILIWSFSVHRHIPQYPLILYAGNESPDQPAQMRRLIRACVVRELHKGCFHALCFNYILFIPIYTRIGEFHMRTENAKISLSFRAV